MVDRGSEMKMEVSFPPNLARTGAKYALGISALTASTISPRRPRGGDLQIGAKEGRRERSLTSEHGDFA
jgi:hypothetical protein